MLFSISWSKEVISIDNIWRVYEGSTGAVTAYQWIITLLLLAEKQEKLG